MSVYFNIRNTLPKFGPFLLWHPVYHVSSHQYISHHFTYLHWTPVWIPLLVTIILTLFIKFFSLQGKDASKPAGKWFLSVCRFSPCQQQPRYHRRRNWKYEQFCVSGRSIDTREPNVSRQDILSHEESTLRRGSLFVPLNTSLDSLRALVFMMHVE